MILITSLNRLYTSEVNSHIQENAPSFTGYVTIGSEPMYFIDEMVIRDQNLPPQTFMLVGVTIKNFSI